MKRFEAIEIEIKELADYQFTPHGKKLLSELKQITDEHSEMVALLGISEAYLRNVANNKHLANKIDAFLTKINDK